MRKYWPFWIPEDKPGLFLFSLNYIIDFENCKNCETKKENPTLKN